MQHLFVRPFWGCVGKCLKIRQLFSTGRCKGLPEEAPNKGKIKQVVSGECLEGRAANCKWSLADQWLQNRLDWAVCKSTLQTNQSGSLMGPVAYYSLNTMQRSGGHKWESENYKPPTRQSCPFVELASANGSKRKKRREKARKEGGKEGRIWDAYLQTE